MNLRKASLKRVRHKMMTCLLRPDEERSYTLSFNLAKRYDTIKPHAGPLVVTAMVSSFRTRRILVDTGSSMDVLFWDAFKRMGISKDRLRPVNSSFVGLVGHRVTSLGMIRLTLMMGEKPRWPRVDANWLVMDCETSYSTILGRPRLTK